MKNKFITKDADIAGGEPIFAGTRIPVRYLFEYVDTGATVEEFLESYPHIYREAVEAVFKERENYNGEDLVL
jgi:uncharacterized protein (DUF433 family)